MLDHILLINLVLVLLFLTLAFWAAKQRNRLDTVDTAWGLGFILLAWATYGQSPQAHSLIVAIMVSIWGLRLSAHIFRRARRSGEDPRYQEMTRKWQGSVWRRAYFSVYLVQAVLIWLVSLPVMVLASSHSGEAGLAIKLGVILWLCGFTIETVADRQLKNFLSRPNHPKVMQAGLWRYSRHPNYFGELLQWWAIGLISLAASWGWLGLLGPAILTYLIVFVSGLPPIEKRHIKDPAYKDYIRKTSPLIPWFPRHN